MKRNLINLNYIKLQYFNTHIVLERRERQHLPKEAEECSTTQKKDQEKTAPTHEGEGESNTTQRR